MTFLIDDAMDLPSQALTLRIGVASRALGRTGTVQLPVEVPKAGGPPAISGLAVTSDDQPPIGVMGEGAHRRSRPVPARAHADVRGVGHAPGVRPAVLGIAG